MEDVDIWIMVCAIQYTTVQERKGQPVRQAQQDRLDRRVQPVQQVQRVLLAQSGQRVRPEEMVQPAQPAKMV